MTSRSFENYTPEELEATLASNPFSFLHVIHPGLKHRELPLEQRFQLVHQQYQVFLQQDILKRDDRPGFYLYHLEKDGQRWQGLFCATSTQDYRDNIIRRHEQTLPRRETLFASYLERVRFNAEPVLMTYAGNERIQNLLEQAQTGAPECCFRSQDGAHHQLWIIDQPHLVQGLEHEFSRVEALYIADGHHRSASSARMAERCARFNANHHGNEPYNYFMSCLIPEEDLKIHAFNRMVRDLEGKSPETFLEALRRTFQVDILGPDPWVPEKEGTFGLYLDRIFYALSYKETPRPSDNPLDQLDSQRLQDDILGPLLGISEQGKDPRLQYVQGKHSVHRMKTLVDQGKYRLGFALHPTSLETIKKVADAGLAMPPKSTYIEPKLRSGLTVYEL